ncbi:hypothetical protein [Leptospira santarosai]|uniref:Uncharacterized protein n=1 Tax=Leptospira santarosai str. MOR084 TaxID=1049984 RepID=A0A0E2BF75_9LEPT|nr:hypothetical protein [Leptospira santarosai]EKO33998.1 hypothetical protein LEP1GSC179_1907 [Leptospira santarosai str. MOR084]EMO71108.1 hypothetical protein LEP1GSC130_0176 [Leptospira santarosai str. 200403458]EMO98212.1 hypothetical protein LEP1GSC120_0694 [Leptospira santarosai str. 200702252]
MIFRILLVCCLFLNSCDKFKDKEEKKVETKTYTKQEKLKMLDVMLSKLLKEIQEKKNFSPFLEVSDDGSGYTIDVGEHTGEELYGGNFQKEGFSRLEKYVTVEEVMRLLKKGSKEYVSEDGGGLSIMLTVDRFEYDLHCYFPEEQGRWVVRRLSRLRPEYPPDYDAKAHCEKWNDCVESKSPKN